MATEKKNKLIEDLPALLSKLTKKIIANVNRLSPAGFVLSGGCGLNRPMLGGDESSSNREKELSLIDIYSFSYLLVLKYIPTFCSCFPTIQSYSALQSNDRAS